MIDIEALRIEIDVFEKEFQDWDEPIPAIARLFLRRLKELADDHDRLRDWLHAIASSDTDAKEIRRVAVNALSGMDGRAKE